MNEKHLDELIEANQKRIESLRFNGFALSGMDPQRLQFYLGALCDHLGLDPNVLEEQFQEQLGRTLGKLEARATKIRREQDLLKSDPRVPILQRRD